MLIFKKVLTNISKKDKIIKKDPNKINVFKFSLLGFNIFKSYNQLTSSLISIFSMDLPTVGKTGPGKNN